MIKKIVFSLLLACTLCSASTVTTTTGTRTLHGQATPVVVCAAGSTKTYRLAYMTVVRGGVDVNIFQQLFYTQGETESIDNLDCFTTYAEVQADFAAKNMQGTLPPKPTGAP